MKKLLVVLLVLGLAAPAMAAEWNWYGHSRVLLSWSMYDEEIDATGDDNRINGNNGVVSIPEGGTTNMIGADVKASDTVEGHFQIGQTSAEGAKFRENYGVWNFGAGKLKVGHMSMPISTIYSTPITTDDGPWIANGWMYSSRTDSVQLQFGGLELAVAKNTGYNTLLAGDVGGVVPGTPLYSVDTRVIPRLEAAYTYRADALNIKVGGNFQTYDLEDNQGENDQTVDSWAALLGIRYMPGPWMIAASGWYAQNPANMTILAVGGLNGLSYQRAVLAGDEVYDSEVYSIALAGRFDLSQMVSVGAGVSYMNSQIEVDGTDFEDEVINWYFQAPIKVAPGVSITPEVGAFMFGDDEVDGDSIRDGGNQYYFSTKFMIMW